MSCYTIVNFILTSLSFFMFLRIVYYCGKFQGMQETHKSYMEIIKDRK